MIKTISTKYKNLDLEITDLREINYFVGKNGSGKTRLFDAVNYEFSTIQKKELEHFTFLMSANNETLFNSLTYCYNSQVDIDSLLVKNIKKNNLQDKNNPYNETRRLQGLYKEFVEHPLTHQIIELFFGENNFEMKMGESEIYIGDNFINFYKNKEKLFSIDECSSGFQSLFKAWNSIFNVNREEIKFKDKSLFYLFSFDEGDRHLHPSLTKLLPEKLELIRNGIKDYFINIGFNPEKVFVQIFVSTHSPFLIRGALQHDNHKIFHLENGILKNSFDKQKLIEQSGLPFDNVLTDLGFEMKDIYYPNCLIYVEGPVEVLFLSYWLEKYFESKGLTNNHFVKGIDYDFVEFGGSLAAHLSLKFNSHTENETVLDKTELVNIFSLNRKVFVMVDNDTDKKAFEKTKQRLKKEIQEKNNGSVFYRNSKYSTIESLLTKSTKRSKRKKDKLEAALVNLKFWRKNNIDLDKFNPETVRLCESIFDFIEKSNI